MSNPEELQEHTHTYMVQDRSNQDEIARVEVQGKMLTKDLGGVLPELDDPSSLQSILDVGCGTGSWLIETARTYPMKNRVGRPCDRRSRVWSYHQHFSVCIPH